MTTVAVPEHGSPQQHRAPFAMPPHVVMRDPTLSLLARFLFVILDGHAGEEHSTRVKQETLASELGESTRTIQRGIAELVEAGLLLVERTGRSNLYRVLNPSRMSQPEAMEQRLEHAEKRRKKQTRDTAGGSDATPVSYLHKKNPSRTNKQKNPSREQEPVAVAEASSAAAARSEREQNSTADPFAVEIMLRALPEHLRPEPTTAVSAAVAEGLSRGWTPEHLAAAIAEQIPNPTAGPGVAVNLLRDLATQPPAEHLRRKERPTWCGECDQGSRLLEVAGGMKRCSACHPLAEHQEQPAAENSATSGDGAVLAEMILADLRARRATQTPSDDQVEGLAQTQPAEALTAALSGSEAQAQAVSA